MLKLGFAYTNKASNEEFLKKKKASCVGGCFLQGRDNMSPLPYLLALVFAIGFKAGRLVGAQLEVGFLAVAHHFGVFVAEGGFIAP